MLLQHLSAAVLASQMLLSIVDEVPKLNFTPSCRAASNMMPANLDACLRDEQNARDSLSAAWSQFSVADKTRCVEGSSAGGSPSYVELLTCLQMARDAAKLPKMD